eukprot:TRINITY_DN10064_c0_g1_i3.p2 TRINITY_DN10064_c0_g1~~TRINITY_DN10064_c0_g1_i3.p2  ORF type:complete len:108 (+),score=31.01 TRINITY_DN10064_c0_g1_i3:929-1252(+)
MVKVRQDEQKRMAKSLEKMQEALRNEQAERAKEIDRLRTKHASMISRREQEHHAEMERVTATWQKKLAIAQGSAETIQDKDRLKLLLAKQQQIVALAGRNSGRAAAT